jgi:hypothetical protein
MDTSHTASAWVFISRYHDTIEPCSSFVVVCGKDLN